MYEIIVSGSFTASHRIPRPGQGWEETHEHAWRVEAAVRCHALDEAGMGIDFRFLKAVLDETMGTLNGHCLNETPPFDAIPPSAEHVARFLFEMLQKSLRSPARMHRVVVWESEGCSAAYIGDNA